jgi:hypothetical protein
LIEKLHAKMDKLLRFPGDAPGTLAAALGQHLKTLSNAIPNVPRSAAGEGHKAIEQAKNCHHWLPLIETR